jgi:hypothetical protein
MTVAVVLAGLAACSAGPAPAVKSPGLSPTVGSPSALSAPPSGEPSGFEPPAPVVCPTATVSVQTAAELRTALADAQPGAVIGLTDGTYAGNFRATARGTADRPIFLCGSVAAVLDAGGIKEGYVFHLDGAAYWRVLGITVRNGQKGVMADAVQHSVLQGVTVSTTGDEAIHFRRGSSDNVIRDSTVRDTGHRRAKFGEGIYLGTATSNWCTISDCQPDQSNRNLVLDNMISQTTAESIDVKEGTTDGAIYGNTFDGSALSGADSWLDMKGSDYRVLANTGAHSPADGFQTHEIVDGAGARNVFADNAGSDLAREDREGVLIGLHPDRASLVRCSNRVADDSAPVTNGTCVP